jgi:site-specific DNA-methyltransferase (adenine-specific)
MILSQSPRIELIHGDCMDYMKSLEDKAFELAICDPPYGINAQNKSATSNQRRSGLQRLNGGGGKLKNRVLNTSKKIEWDYSIPNDKYFNELKRVSKNQIIWGGNYFPLPPSRCIICWDKCQPWENFSQIELAWTSFDMPARIFRFDNRTGGKIHPTQKPVALYKWLIKNYAKPGDRILDTHLGSGSSAIAAWEAGRDFVGIELDEEYYNAAVKRFRQHIAQTKLF